MTNLATTDQTNIIRKMEDGRRSLILNPIDVTRFRSVCLGQRWIKTGWIFLKRQNIWPMVQPMSELGEFVSVSGKFAVRDSVTQIGNNTSKSETSIQSRTASNVGEMENLATDQLEAVQQREHRDTRDFLGTGTSSSRRCQYQEENKRANVASIRTTKRIVAFLYYNIVQITRLVFYRPWMPHSTTR